MPVDWSVLNGWVDDDGSNTVGNLTTKAAFQAAIRDPIDAALGDAAGSTTQVQFNDAGAMAGDAGLTYNKTTDALTTGSLIPTLGQIKFPATQNASSDANTLDDYEEGSWTPTIGGSGGQSGQVYSVQSGGYIKVGKQVFVRGRVVLSTLGTVTTSVQIQGLPFQAANVEGASVTFGRFDALTATVVWVGGTVTANGTSIDVFHRAAAAASATASTQATLSNTIDFIFSATYEAV